MRLVTLKKIYQSSFTEVKAVKVNFQVTQGQAGIGNFPLYFRKENTIIQQVLNFSKCRTTSRDHMGVLSATIKLIQGNKAEQPTPELDIIGDSPGLRSTKQISLGLNIFEVTVLQVKYL